MELSPGALRTFIVGTSYQLGNLVSSASSTIESMIGESLPLLPTDDGTKRYQYGKVICIFLSCVYAYVIIIALLGAEFLGRKLDGTDDEDVRTAVGEGAFATVEAEEDSTKAAPARVDSGMGDEEKAVMRQAR